ncbi:hypothetical protein ACWEIK_12780 [Streptomyces sp. NPDC004673]
MSEEIVYIRGDATAPCAEGARVIAHVRNDFGLGAVQLVSGRPAGRGVPVTGYDHGEAA